MDITEFVLNPVTLLAIVFGVVEFVKSLGVEGNKLRWISLATGILLAFLFKVTELVPVYSPYIQTIFFGVAVGLAASGVFSFLDKRIARNGPPPVQ
jgi:uncharacterized membrane protein HdeD (DUF308 family)